ncbi:hypothetical protein FACS1894182_03270 [Bacteroidia bacterium]|nr:hypothetical protein FACS1894182_03270 [Bacteroidia bacterium]
MKNFELRLDFRMMDANNLREWTKIHREVFGVNVALYGCAALDKELCASLPQFELYMDLEYWIAYHDGKAVGATGLYKIVGESKNESWLGWFGVLPNEQGKGYGNEMLTWTEEFAKRERDATVMRYYTEIDKQGTREKALGLYRKHGFNEEYYYHPEAVNFPSKYGFQMIVGSKSLVGSEVPLWNNRYLDLARNFNKAMTDNELNKFLTYTIKKLKRSKSCF